MNVRRIRRLKIDGFGHFRERDWEIHPRLQLFFGRNEAGKSTLLAFVRGVLFGFEPRSSARRYEPFSGGPFGGAVWMEDEGGWCVRIRRDGRGRAAGRLAVDLPDGRSAGEDWLQQWLGGIDRGTFRQVFAFGLDDLQQAKWLKDEALTPFLYHTLTGGGSLETVRKGLDEQEKDLFRPRGRTGPIHDLLQELEELDGRCRRLRRQRQDVARLRRRLAEVEEEGAALEQEMKAMQEEMERLEQLARFVQPYRRLRALAAELDREGGHAAGPDGDDVAEGGEQAAAAAYWQQRRLEEEARLEALRERAAAVAEEKSRLERQLALPADGAAAAVETDRSDPGLDSGWVSALPAVLGLALAAGWSLWFWLERGVFSPALWVPAALFLLAGIGGSALVRTMVERRVSRREQLRNRLLEDRGRLAQEEGRIREEMAAAERRMDRLREAEALAAVLESWSGDPPLRRQLAAWAARSDDALAGERERLEKALSEKARRYAAGLEERGRLLEQLDGERKKRDELMELERQMQERRARLHRLACRWSAAVLARCALEETLAAYERERQPRTLRQASDYLAQLTGGRYRRVFAPLGERELLVERADGERLAPSHLSRGTLEQLLLAMRLALADEYNGRAVLPLMMDDIFVNFDAGRLRQAVETLKALSEGRQILFLTCHPHVVEEFRRVLAGADWGFHVLDDRFP